MAGAHTAVTTRVPNTFANAQPAGRLETTDVLARQMLINLPPLVPQIAW